MCGFLFYPVMLDLVYFWCFKPFNFPLQNSSEHILLGFHCSLFIHRVPKWCILCHVPVMCLAGLSHHVGCGLLWCILHICVPSCKTLIHTIQCPPFIVSLKKLLGTHWSFFIHCLPKWSIFGHVQVTYGFSCIPIPYHIIRSISIAQYSSCKG